MSIDKDSLGTELLKKIYGEDKISTTGEINNNEIVFELKDTDE